MNWESGGYLALLWGFLLTSLRLCHQAAATRHDVLKSLYLLWSARDCFSCCNSSVLFFSPPPCYRDKDLCSAWTKCSAGASVKGTPVRERGPCPPVTTAGSWTERPRFLTWWQKCGSMCWAWTPLNKPCVHRSSFAGLSILLQPATHTQSRCRHKSLLGYRQ